MHEILVDRRQVVAMHHRVHQLLAHRDERRGAAGREIEPAEKLLPARLGGKMQFGGGLVACPRAPRHRPRHRSARGRRRSGWPAPRRTRCAGRWSVRRSVRKFRARARRPRLRRARTAIPRTVRPGCATVPQRHRAGRARGRSARGRAPRSSAASRRRKRCSSSDRLHASAAQVPIANGISQCQKPPESPRSLVAGVRFPLAAGPAIRYRLTLKGTRRHAKTRNPGWEH